MEEKEKGGLMLAVGKGNEDITPSGAPALGRKSTKVLG